MSVSLRLEALPVKDQPWLEYKAVFTLCNATQTVVAKFDDELETPSGTYTFDTRKQILDIKLTDALEDNKDGSNESLTIILTKKQYTDVLANKKVAVTFKSERFYKSPMAGMLSLVATCTKK